MTLNELDKSISPESIHMPTGESNVEVAESQENVRYEALIDLYTALYLGICPGENDLPATYYCDEGLQIGSREVALYASLYRNPYSIKTSELRVSATDEFGTETFVVLSGSELAYYSYTENPPFPGYIEHGYTYNPKTKTFEPTSLSAFSAIFTNTYFGLTTLPHIAGLGAEDLRKINSGLEFGGVVNWASFDADARCLTIDTPNIELFGLSELTLAEVVAFYSHMWQGSWPNDSFDIFRGPVDSSVYTSSQKSPPMSFESSPYIVVYSSADDQ